MNRFRIERHQHAVGHGFFHTSSVNADDPKRPQPFHYVYDCGSKKRQALLVPAINSYIATLGEDPIDLLVLSHFHSDHTNGLDELLKWKKVKTAIIPYVSNDERLLLIGQLLAKPGSRFDEIQMAANPRRWLLSRGVANVITIKAGDGDVQSQFPNDSSPAQAGPEGTWDLRIGSDSVSDLKEGRRVSHGTPVIVKSSETTVLDFRFFCWNADETAGRFHEQWEKHGEQPLDGVIKDAVLLSLLRDKRKVLVDCYARVHKEGLNWSTLCLRAEPCVGRHAGVSVTMPSPLVQTFPWLECSLGWLGTGDLELADDRISKDFIKHYSKPRRVFSLSLPHHGSKRNFDPVLLREFRPAITFVTCPNASKHHPDPEVVRIVNQMGTKFHRVDESPANDLHESVVFWV